MIAIVVLGCVPLSACRDKEPTPSLYVDLGEGDRPLPPPAKTPWLDASLKSGRAEWQAFREPSGEMPVNDGSADAGAGVAAPTTGEGGAVSPEVASRVESEIRAMLADYNAAAAEGKTDELLDFYVADQVDKVKAIFAQQATFVSTMAEFKTLLSGKLAAETDRINRVFDALNKQAQERLMIEAISVLGENEATGVMTGLPEGTMARFVVEEDAWYIELPQSYLEAAQSQMPPLIQSFEQSKTALAGGQAPAEQILAAFEQIAESLGLGGGGADPAIGSPPTGADEGRSAEVVPGAGAGTAPAPPSAETISKGADAFTSATCFKCHGQDGTGGARGPNLTDGEWVHCDGSIEGILQVLRSGVSQDRLVNKDFPFAMNPVTDIIQDNDALMALATYVHSLSQ